MNHRHREFVLNAGQQGQFIQSTSGFDYQSHPQRTQPYGPPSDPRPPPPQPLARPPFTPQHCPAIRQRYVPPPPPPGVGQPCQQERASHRSSFASPRPLPLRSPGNGFWLPPPHDTTDFRQGQVTEDGGSNTCPKARETGDLPKTSTMSDHSEKENSVTPVVLDLDMSTNNLPSELEKLLKSLMQPLFCKLCNAFLNAPNQAQQHYSGKSHAKKVRLFVKDAEAKSTDLPKSKLVDSATDASSKTLIMDDEKLADQSSASEEMKPLLTETNSVDCSSSGSKQKVTAEEYCGLCDASFNSPKQAEQHYHGKKPCQEASVVSHRQYSPHL
ncbi:uncharacterized protein LOC135465844 [Liolophura sinensis]|uniref:uncharacterized protein LOC135465844 n=1 Tax=Liolophura sinensis TaxID=3198878 RepID=UPI0031596D4F